MQEIPIQYKEVTDSTVYKIGKSVQRLIPIIEELGNNMEIEVEDYIVTIKRKEIMTWQKYIITLKDKINDYIVANWNGKQITPEIGLKHWLFIQDMSFLINQSDSEVNVKRLVIKPEDAANALDIVIKYINNFSDQKEKAGFIEVPKAERETAKKLNEIKLHILGYN